MSAKTILAILSATFLLCVAAVSVISLIPIYIPNRSKAPRFNHTTATSNRSSVRIAIIGAGISGLNAGLSLLDSNLFSPENIIIYEANNYIGGRIHTHIWPSSNQTSEWCGEFLDSNYYQMINLTQRFNLTLIDTVQANNPDIYQTTLYFLSRFYSSSQAWIDYQPVGEIMKQQIDLIGDISFNQSNANGTYFDRLSLYDWIEKYVPNGHRSQLGQYLDSAYKQQFGIDTQELSSLTLLFNLDPYSQPPNGPLLIYGSSDQRYRINGGNYLLPTRIAKYLQNNNIIIQMNYNLTKITVTTDHKISLSFANGETILFDHVILTLPLSTLRYVDYSQAQFDTLKTRIINEFRYATNTKLNLQFSKRFWLEKSSNGYIYTDLPFLNSWEASTGQSGQTGILVLYTGGSDGTSFTPRSGFDSISNYEISSSTNWYIRQFLNDLNEIWPNASSYYTGEGTISAPWIDPHFLGSYPSRTRGQFSTLRGYEKQRQMNIHFAGDYTSLNYSACMEGAIIEGRRAALEVIADY
ncbi:unnamed protein product [Adineta steineri]|uniref:Amine oxidase n=1 Tax=Adineta steineri TaxID=433720 RepID=A0A814KBI3_9BILA|nr:unnamed protein product [Adineta steineri]CAF1081831.1 unnamed protein product [Adineta steineri]